MRLLKRTENVSHSYIFIKSNEKKIIENRNLSDEWMDFLQCEIYNTVHQMRWSTRPKKKEIKEKKGSLYKCS